MDVRAATDPEVAAAIDAAAGWMPALSAETLPVFRGIVAPLVEPPPGVERSVVQVRSTDGALVEVRVHRPLDAAVPRPALVWIHGGGYVMGAAAMDDGRLGDWAARLGCVTVSVDYRLAPEVPYPGALEDCLAALGWLHEASAALGVDRGRIGIGGISAGGGLTAAVALAARDRGSPAVAFQCMVYPMLDDRMASPSSAWDSAVWPPASNRFGWDAYLRSLGTDEVPGWASAARATDLAGLPPALMVAGALDCLVDEDVEYAMRLNRAGVPCELHVYPGAGHGLESMAPQSRPGRQLRRDVEAWLVRALAGELLGPTS